MKGAIVGQIEALEQRQGLVWEQVEHTSKGQRSAYGFSYVVGGSGEVRSNLSFSMLVAEVRKAVKEDDVRTVRNYTGAEMSIQVGDSRKISYERGLTPEAFDALAKSFLEGNL